MTDIRAVVWNYIKSTRGLGIRLLPDGEGFELFNLQTGLVLYIGKDSDELAELALSIPQAPPPSDLLMCGNCHQPGVVVFTVYRHGSKDPTGYYYRCKSCGAKAYMAP